MIAELLRKAATILRERAEDARLGVGADPWRFDSTGWCDPHGTTYEVTTDLPGDGEVYAVAHTGIEEPAAYIATMHPGVGLALADWLADEALMIETSGRMTNSATVTLARLIVGEQS